MDAVTTVTSDLFGAIGRLREADGMGLQPELVHQRFTTLIEEARYKGREEGMQDRDVQEMLYAIIALIDEVALSKPEPMRGFWSTRPLQLQYFNDNLAGENFFQRMQQLRGDRRRADVLRVYYLCMQLGFQGRYAIRGGEVELMRIGDVVRKDVEAAMDIPDELSPAGAPPEEPLVRKGDRNPFLWVSLGVFAIAIAVFIGLRISLDSRVAEVTQRVEELTR